MTVRSAGDHAGERADAAVTPALDAPLAAIAADCAALALVADVGIGVVHCGWRGLVVGAVPAAVEALRAMGATTVTAVLGPVIEAPCYEFGADDLASVVAELGPTVATVTAAGRPALDMVAGVGAALDRCGATLSTRLGGCTACDDQRWYSHRARGETGRHALVVWRSPAAR